MAMEQLNAKRVVTSVGQQGAGQRAVDVLRQMLDGPGAASAATQPAARSFSSSADLVANLMLDRRASSLYQQAIDGWLATGGTEAFEAPVPLPPAQEAELQRRMTALVAGRSPLLAVSGAPQLSQSPPGRQVSKPVLDGGPSSTKMVKTVKSGGDPAMTRRPYGKKNAPNSLSVLNRYLAKAAAGPGSRGGHVIGTTSSGKPIYGSGHEANHSIHQAMHAAGHGDDQASQGAAHAGAAHPSYSAEDHMDAAEAHQSAAGSMSRGDPHRQNSHYLSQAHAFASQAKTRAR